MLGTLVTAGITLGVGILSSSSAKKAAKTQFEAAKKSAQVMATANREISENDRDFSKEQAQKSYDIGLRTLNQETSSKIKAWEIDSKALATEKGRTGALYRQQTESLVNTGLTEIELSVGQALDRYTNAVSFLRSEMDYRRSKASREAAEIQAQIRDEKSDAAVEADRAIATAKVAAADRGALGTNSYLRLMNEGQYYKGVSIDRIERQGGAALADLSADLQFAAVQAENAGREAQIALGGSIKEASLFASKLSEQLEMLNLQHVFDMESLDLEGEALEVEMADLQDRYNLSTSILGEQLTLANKLADHVFENSEIQIDAQEEAMIAGALATRNAQVSLANTSFLTGILKAGADIFGNYQSNLSKAKAFSAMTGTPIDKSRDIFGASLSF